MTDRDDGRVKAALTRWLADHGVSDPAIGAVEIVHMVRGHGWRPVEALKPPPAPQPSQGLPAEYLERKAALISKSPEGAPDE